MDHSIDLTLGRWDLGRRLKDGLFICLSISSPTTLFYYHYQKVISREMSTALKRGLFIVVEGLDRSGKSTQALALQKALQLANIQSELIRFPGTVSEPALYYLLWLVWLSSLTFSHSSCLNYDYPYDPSFAVPARFSSFVSSLVISIFFVYTSSNMHTSRPNNTYW